jgi:hypothetical protein
VIPHPVKPNTLLIHACLEGPEAGVYYRGKGQITNNFRTRVLLPDYVSSLATDFTIQITPINGKTLVFKPLSVSEVVNNYFDVFGENCEFFWLVFGMRNSIVVESNIEDVVIQGAGPYKWIEHN